MKSKRKVLLALTINKQYFIRGVVRYAREHDWYLVTDMMYGAGRSRIESVGSPLALAKASFSPKRKSSRKHWLLCTSEAFTPLHLNSAAPTTRKSKTL